MAKERFTHFREGFVQLVGLIKKGNIDAVLADFLKGYRELTAEFVLSDLMKVSEPDPGIYDRRRISYGTET